MNHVSCAADVFGSFAKTKRNSKSANRLLKEAGKYVCGMPKVQQKFYTQLQLHRVREGKQSSFSSEFEGNR